LIFSTKDQDGLEKSDCRIDLYRHEQLTEVVDLLQTLLGGDGA
jgi:hypothetical protein